jgi:hypothetical protein
MFHHIHGTLKFRKFGAAVSNRLRYCPAWTLGREKGHPRRMFAIRVSWIISRKRQRKSVTGEHGCFVRSVTISITTLTNA